MAIRVGFFESSFDFNSRNRFDPTRFSIPTLGIDSPRLSGRIDPNCQDSNQLIDPNSINRPDAVSLLLLKVIYYIFAIKIKFNILSYLLLYLTKISKIYY